MAVSTPLDCVVIGAGPGGLVAAIYLQRLRRRVLLIDGGDARAARIPKIRNLVGYEDGISGKSLLKRLHRQYAKCGGRLLKGRALVRKRGKRFVVEVNKTRLDAHKVILATGQRDVEPPFGNLRELTQEGLLGYCPICDGIDHRDQRIALLIKDEKGLKKIDFMLGFSSRLVVIAVQPFKVPAAAAREASRRRIPIIQGPVARVEKMKKRGLRFHFNEREPLETDAAYVLMGSQIPGDAIQDLRGVKKTEDGNFVVSSHQETSIPGLFAIGDCVQALSQVSVAVGHAAIAATHVHNCLRQE